MPKPKRTKPSAEAARKPPLLRQAYHSAAPGASATVTLEAGDYAAVEVTRTTTGTLMGVCLGRTTLAGFHRLHGAAWAERAEGGGVAMGR